MDNLVCDLCGSVYDHEDMIKVDELMVCSDCRCEECGEVTYYINKGVFNPSLCIKCEKKYYLEVVEV